MSGRKIIQSLQEAADGNFARVTIEGQTWIRQTPLIAAAPDLLSIAERWLALDGEDWRADRYTRDKRELKTDTQAAIARAKGESE